MAFGRPPILNRKDPNPALSECIGMMSAVRERLAGTEFAFQLREVLTTADIAEAQAELSAVGTILTRLNTELADPASGVRIKGGRRIAL